jgi:thiol reductant ABC exporter CydC subunit
MKRTFPYLLSSAAYVAGIGLIISSAWLITTASFRPPLMTLGMAIVGVRFFGISRSAARYFERLTSHRQVFDRLSQLRVRLFEALTANPQTSNSLRLVRDESSGTLVKRVVDDIERVQEYELRITMPHVAGAISVLIAVVLGGWILPISLIITLPVSVLLLFVMPFFIKARCERLARRIEVLENDYATLVQQALHGMAEAQFYGYLSERLQQTQQMEEEIMQEEKSLLRANSKFAFFTVAAFGAVLVSLAWMAQSSAHAIPAVKVSMIIFLPLVMFEAVTLWYPNLLGAGKLLLARDEVSEIIDAEKIKEESRTSLSKPITQVVAREVQAKWGEGEHFMEPVSFSVAAGGSLVIRGRSGVGKSTLAMALLGLLDYDGEILLNGIDLRLIENVPVAGTIQSSHIFNTSLRENLKIAASDADDMELVAVLGKVELDLLLTQLPDGLDTIIGQFGRALSGGEAKRLSLARALLSKAEVLVLDEPTEHLDHDLAVRLERRILEMNRILIVITHSGWESASATLQLVR